VRFGVQLWPQQTDWPAFRDATLAAEDAGWDGVWAWDHLLAIVGPPEQPIFEGWSLLAVAAAESAFEAQLAANGATSPGVPPTLLGPPEAIADAIRPYRDLGFATVVVRMPAPYDHETLRRIGEVAGLLDG
jgi:alkanesulfonate monooxygenase SsuD/methylene tetrahydromethanopterin reductase-like flavin-dependent oxidoreductase (luciferase family)